MRIPPSWQALLLLPLVLLGCYMPAPADPATIAPGEDLQIVLSDQGRERLSEISAQVQGELSGQLLRLTEDSLTITTRLRGPINTGPAFGSLRQTLTFARADIQQITVPRLDRGRTSMIVTGAVVVIGVLGASFFDIVGNPGKDAMRHDQIELAGFDLDRAQIGADQIDVL